MKSNFSVLIPVYKRENPVYFDSALSSVFIQSIMPNEVVICEDGPLTDELLEVIKKYQNKYNKIIKIIAYPENRGLGRTLRDGLLECSNEIVFRMDSDDISTEKRFEKQLDVLLSKKVDVVGSNISEYDETMNVRTGDRKLPEKHEDIKLFLRRRNPMNHMTVCFKKSRVVESGNYEDMPGFEDYYLWARMMKNGCKFYNIQESLVKVRGGDGMIKRRGGVRYYNQVVNFEKALRKLGLISKREYFENIAIRTLSLASPTVIRKKVYNRTLRSLK